MTTDPVQPDSSLTTDSAASPEAAPVQPEAAPAEAVVAQHQPAEADSAGARIREKMAAATDALPQPDETTAAPAT